MQSLTFHLPVFREISSLLQERATMHQTQVLRDDDPWLREELSNKQELDDLTKRVTAVALNEIRRGWAASYHELAKNFSEFQTIEQIKNDGQKLVSEQIAHMKDRCNLSLAIGTPQEPKKIIVKSQPFPEGSETLSGRIFVIDDRNDVIKTLDPNCTHEEVQEHFLAFAQSLGSPQGYHFERFHHQDKVCDYRVRQSVYFDSSSHSFIRAKIYDPVPKEYSEMITRVLHCEDSLRLECRREIAWLAEILKKIIDMPS